MKTPIRLSFAALLTLTLLIPSLTCEEPLPKKIPEIKQNTIQAKIVKLLPHNTTRMTYIPNYERGHHATLFKFTGMTPYTKYVKKFIRVAARKHVIALTRQGRLGAKTLEFLKKMSMSTELMQTNEGTEYDIFVTAGGFMPGEIVELKIYSENDDRLYQHSFIPQPISAESPSGQLYISCELHSFLGLTQYQIDIGGMKKDESYQFSSKSYDETVTFPIPPNQTKLLYSPDVLGKTGGCAEITISSSKDTVNFTLPWGADLMNYWEGDIYYTPSGPRKVADLTDESRELNQAPNL